MKINHLRIENFRSIRTLDLPLDETTVFIGPNNAGKSAILEAVRIGLSRRWGQQGTGFTEDDVHCSKEDSDARTAPPVKISLLLQEPSVGSWPLDMVTELEEVMTLTADGLNRVAMSVSYVWKAESKNFVPNWEFLDSAGNVLSGRRRSINTSPFFNYLLFFWLGALRDADDEFSAKSRHWGGLLRSIQIPAELEAEVKTVLDDLDGKLLAADPKFAQISKTVGRATEVAAGEKPGAAKLRMLPINVRDLVSRAGIVLQNENLRPWLPLDHHGQGLQSLSVIFLFQAAVMQKLSEEIEGAEAVFAIEEPEVHLHPHAARTLWNRIEQLPGQKLVTTHSPYFVQNVPLHYLRIVRFAGGTTQVASLKEVIVSDLPWTKEVGDFVTGKRLSQFAKDPTTGCLTSNLWFDAATAGGLLKCLGSAADGSTIKERLSTFRRNCRVLVSGAEESELAFLGRRIRGEIFFAREWILVEGPSEFLLLQAIGSAFGYDLDQHGISVIDFQNNGNANIYPALAEAFEIPWVMVTDGDAESEKFKAQLLKRGFIDADLAAHFSTLTKPNDLEAQLLLDGHETILRDLLAEVGIANARTCDASELLAILRNKKTAYMARLAPRVAKDADLASTMPSALVSVIKSLKAKYDAAAI